MTRRELLTLLLGAPIAAAACARGSRPKLPPGEIVGASDAVGHRLREPHRITPPADAWTSHEVVIVGAGVAGLSAAWRFAQAGLNDFVLLDLEPVIGGTSRSGSSRVSAYPWGAHYIPVPLRENRTLIRVLNAMSILDGVDADGNPVAAEQFLCRDPEERIFYRGRWYEGLYLNAGASADDLRQLHAFESEMAKWVAWRDAKARRAFVIPIANASDDAEVMALDRMSMRDWMDQHRFTSWRLRWLVDYSCRDDYGARLEDTSAWAGVFYFTSRVAKAGKESEPLITFPEGNGRLVAHLAQSSRGHADTGWLVTSVIPTEAGVDVIAISHDGRKARGIHAKQVVFAGPQFVAAQVIPDYRDVRDFEYGSWLVANLTLRDRPRSQSPSFPLAWDNVLVESPGLGYVVATHQTEADYGPTVLTYYYAMCHHDPRVVREQLLSLGRDAWADFVLTDLARAHPDIRDLTEHLDVMRWGHAMVRPHPGFIASQSLRTARVPLRNIHFAHSDLSGVALFEEALHHGVRAAEEILGARGGESFL